MTVLTDLSKYMNLPVSFVLQEFSLENFQNLRDINDFSLLHIAVLNNNIDKVLELVHSNYSTTLISKTSDVPFELLKKWVPFDFDNSMKIIFSDDGYTPIHLNIYLLNLYHKLNPQKKGFLIQQFYQYQQKILDLFIENDSLLLKQQDKKGFTVFDYAFLFENSELINKFYGLDCTFSGLHFVTPYTAIKICQMINLKNNTLKNSNNLYISDDLIEKLNKKMLNDKLSVDLNTKKMIKSNKI